MVTVFKWLSRPLQVSLGVVWALFCFFLFIATGSVFGKQGSSQVKESKEVSVDVGNMGEKPKPKSWTVHCEREDGTQGIFRVSSNLPQNASTGDPNAKAKAEKATQQAEAVTMENEAPANPDDEDPFGSPTLKCGRLLTLLAIFATAESASP